MNKKFCALKQAAAHQVVVLIILFSIDSAFAACPTSCKVCNSDTQICEVCQSGFYLQNNQCNPCPSNCSICRVSNSQVQCLQCIQPNYFISENQTCLLCSSPCSQCISASTSCSSCEAGYWLQQKDCLRKTECVISGCSICNQESLISKIQICDVCTASAKYFFWRTCIESSPHCQQSSLINDWENIKDEINQTLVKAVEINQLSSFPILLQLFQNYTLNSLSQYEKKLWTYSYYIYKGLILKNTEDNQITYPIPNQNYNFFLDAMPLISTILQNQFVSNQGVEVNKLETFVIMHFAQKYNIDMSAIQLLQIMTNYIVKKGKIKCQRCSAGYFPRGQYCQSCISNCRQCEQTNGDCLICQDGFFLIQKSNQAQNSTISNSITIVKICVKCDDQNCKNCIQNQSICTECNDPYSLDPLNKICVLCQQPCQTCKSTNLSFCFTCNTSLFAGTADSEGKCKSCNILNCLSCSNQFDSICSVCRSGFWIRSGKCQECPEGCMECFIPNNQILSQNINIPICSSCKQSYFLTDQFANGRKNLCQRCRYPCKSCEQTGKTCLSCLDQFYFEQAQASCMKCKQGCFKCINYTNCSESKAGYIIIDYQPIKCPPGCQTCNPNDTTKCDSCIPRHFLNQQKCTICHERCVLCLNLSSCLQCQKGYMLNSGECIKCVDSCTVCQENQFYNPNYTEIINQTVDLNISVSEAMEMLKNLNLSQIDSRAIMKQASLDPKQFTKCTRCEVTYFLFGGKCVNKCGSYCLVCNKDGFCQQCFKGFSLTNQGSCLRCLKNCTGQCSKYNILNCLSCSQGYFNQDGICYPCSENCSRCNQLGCLSCQQGYKMIQKTYNNYGCVKQKCKYPCLFCTEGNICQVCSDGFLISNNKCIPDLRCNPNCIQCPLFTQRQQNSNSCFQCSSNCVTCAKNQSDSNIICKKCEEGFYLSQITLSCFSCFQNCQTCFSYQQCEICKQGYIKRLSDIENKNLQLKSDECVACTSNCRICTLLPNLCLSCNEGYQLRNLNCIGLYTVRIAFRYEFSQMQFLTQGLQNVIVQELAGGLSLQSTEIYISNISTSSEFINQDKLEPYPSQPTRILTSDSIIALQSSTTIEIQVSGNNFIDSQNLQYVLMNFQFRYYTPVERLSAIYYLDQLIPARKVEYSTIEPDQQKKLNNAELGLIIGVSSGGGLLLIIVIIIVIIKIRKNKQESSKVSPQQINEQIKEQIRSTNEKDKAEKKGVSDDLKIENMDLDENEVKPKIDDQQLRKQFRQEYKKRRMNRKRPQFIHALEQNSSSSVIIPRSNSKSRIIK